ncbi:hypothetical protein EP331_04900 [bacterium]|nr:MAG: hypothetical protein EP331_04900 [bacterium]
MKKLLLLFWLLPGYLLFLTSYEAITYWGLTSTYKNGASLVAHIDELKLKNMQAQSNGVIQIHFTTSDGLEKQHTFTLPIQLAAQLQNYNMIPIRYMESSSMPIVFMPTYDFHKDMVLMNVGITFISFLVTFFIGFKITKYSFKPTEAERLNQAVQDAWKTMQPES